MKNLITQYKKLTPKEIALGKIWYEDAHEYCVFLANKYNLGVATVAGIIAALSPATSWARNKKEAEWLIESQYADYEMEPFRFTTYGQNVTKAHNILASHSPW